MSERDDAERGDEIGCAEAVRRLASFLDGELEPAARDEVEEHLERCRSCFSRAEFERRLRDRIRSDLAVESVPPEFETRMRRLLARLPDEA